MRTARGRALIPVAGVTATGALGLHRIFAWPDLLPVVLPAVAVPVVLAWLLTGRARPAPLWLAMMASAAGWLIAVLVVLQGEPMQAGLAEGLRDGWRTILVTVPPMPGRPGLLVFPLTLTWLAAFIAAETALRTARVFTVVLPGLALMATGLLLGVGGPDREAASGLTTDLLVAAGFAVCCGLLLLLRAAKTGLWPATRGAAIIAVVAALAMLVTPAISLPRAYDLRERVAAGPEHQRRAVSPIDLIAPWLLKPDTDLFTVESAQGRRWRLAVFDTFDGVRWSHSERSQPSGGRVPAGPSAAVVGEQRDRVTILGLPGAWLPAADRPASVTGVAIEVEPESGTLLSREPLHEGMRYDVVVSTIGEPDPQRLRTASAAGGPETAIGGLFEDGQETALADLRHAAQAATAGAAYPFQQAVMLQSYLRENLAYDVRATPGHTYRAMQLFLRTTHRGTSEHFASTFAVMARALGLPSRVVVGFRPGLRQGGLWRVRSGDVMAWPEVNFAGVGWVAFQPTPEAGSASAGGGDNAAAAGLSAARQAVEKQVLEQAELQRPDPVGGQRSLSPPVARDHGIAWPAVISVLLLLLLSYVGGALATPGWRRRRARSADGTHQVRLAWRRAIRRLAPILGETATMTNREIRAAGVAAIGPDAETPLGGLADLADRADFGGQPLRSKDGELAWAHCRTLERLAAGRIPAFRRWSGRLHPRRFGD